MVYLKEDGSLDVERINQLPLEEWMDMVGDMTNMEKKFLNEDGSIDFDKFALLTESEQVSYMEKWTPQQWMAYRMQNTISEEECFGPVLKLIDEIEEGKFNGFIDLFNLLS